MLLLVEKARRTLYGRRELVGKKDTSGTPILPYFPEQHLYPS